MKVPHRPHHRLTWALALGLGAAAFAAPAASAHQSRTDAVSTWNENAGKAAVAACISPVGPSPAEARLYAMTHIAIHDALNAIDRRSRPYVFRGRARQHASTDAAVAAAARDVMVPVIGSLPPHLAPPACVTAALAGVEADYVTALDAVRDGRAKRRGVAVGQAAAKAILALRVADDAYELLSPDFDYDEGTLPGEYRFGPGTPLAFGPEFGKLTPFALREGSQFRPGPPHAVTDPRYTADFNEIKRLGGDDGATPSARTPDETEIALFWYESSTLQWNRIARRVAARRLGAWEQARLFGLLNIALADGYIGTFETKYHYKYWRPVTAIRLAATDGNPDTDADPGWTPLRETPPVPDYDSGHAVEGGAGAKVLQRFFGNRVRFTTCSTTLQDAANNCGGTAARYRTYHSFSQAARENGRSRILIGFHFREGVEVGTDHGGRIAGFAVDRLMRPRGR